MACFADINVSQGSVATYARCGGISNIHLTANLSWKLPVKCFKSVKIRQKYGHESVAQLFGQFCTYFSFLRAKHKAEFIVSAVAYRKAMARCPYVHQSQLSLWKVGGLSNSVDVSFARKRHTVAREVEICGFLTPKTFVIIVF